MPPSVFYRVRRYPAVISRWLSHVTERQNPTTPFSFFEVTATIRFILRHREYHVTTIRRNTITINEEEEEEEPPLQSFVDNWSEITLQDKTFPIEVPMLLSTECSMGPIGNMLADLHIIPPSSIERLKIEISMFAMFWALDCQQRNAGFLDMVIELDVPLVVNFRNIVALILDEDLQDNGGFSLLPASRSSIEALELKTFDDTQEEEEVPTSSTTTATDTCMICMDEYVRGVEIAQLPCSHVFHRDCIFKWLEHKNTCPYCRFAMPTET